MKRAKDIIIWTIILAYIGIAFGFIAEKHQALVCTRVDVHIVDSFKNSFIGENRIKTLLDRRGFKLIGQPFSDIDLDSIESYINTLPPVEKGEVYKTTDGRVVVDITQRTPIIRVIDNNNDSYYIDNNGFIMPMSGNFTSYVIVANGNIRTNFAVNKRTNVLKIEEASKGKQKLFADLYRLGKFITSHKFWNAQIQQIYVDGSGDFELIPRVGSHVILFGDYSDCETKFDNLMSLYKNGFPVKGWNTYETINLKYKGQVICSKRN